MARLLNLLGYGSSVLATVCLILALVAAPIGVARADEPTTCQSICSIYPSGSPEQQSCYVSRGQYSSACAMQHGYGTPAFYTCLGSYANNGVCNVNCQQSHPKCGNGNCRPPNKPECANMNCCMTANYRYCD